MIIIKKTLSHKEMTNAMEYLTDQFKEGGDSPWLEGWVCGFTDPVHEYGNGDWVRSLLLDHISCLKDKE